MTFSEKLTALRRERGWSQEELGGRLRVSRQTVSKWEQGQTTPEMAKLIELAALFSISLDELAGLAETGPTTAKEIVYVPVETGYHYEYTSKRTLWGLPLVQINLGRGLRRARGVIAIGNIATGFVSIGAVSVGLVSFGAVSLGLLALGAFTLGLLAAGAISIGLLAVGGIAVGLLSFGGVAVGVYAVGGCAYARDVALGGVATGTVAIGDTVRGAVTFSASDGLRGVDPEAVRRALLAQFPTLSDWLVRLFTSF